MTRLSPKSEGLDTVMMIRQRKITKHILIDENPLENSIAIAKGMVQIIKMEI